MLPALLAFVIGGGALFIWWTAAQTDREMHADLLRQTELLAQSMNIERIKKLIGTEADLENPTYLRVKEQFAIFRATNPQCRFLYLLGRKPDGTIFFFLDSESAESKDYSLPGQVYTEASEGFRGVFARQAAMVEGPYIDRWGTWTSGLVPIHDPQTTLSGLATPADAQEMVHVAIEYYRTNGRDRLLKEINNPQGDFLKGDLYAFAYDVSMTMQAHPVQPEMVGKNQLDEKDWAGGNIFTRKSRKSLCSRVPVGSIMNSKIQPTSSENPKWNCRRRWQKRWMGLFLCEVETLTSEQTAFHGKCTVKTKD